MNVPPALHHSLAAGCLAALLFGAGSVLAQTGTTDAVSEENLKAAGERMRQTSLQLQQDIQQRLQRLRSERAALVARQEAERREEAERLQRQADQDRAALAAIKETKQRSAFAAAREKARKEAAARAADAERQRQAELKEKDDQEAALARAQQESLDAYKAGAKKQKLGSETQFGVDL